MESTCSMEELKKRIMSPSRQQFQKLTSVEMFEQLNANGSFDVSYIPQGRVTVGTSIFTASEAAARIAHELELD